MQKKGLAERGIRRGQEDANRTTPAGESLRNFIRSASLVKHPGAGRRTRTQHFIRQLETALKASHQLPTLTLTGLADALNLEPTYCCRVFRQHTGMSFSDWRRRIRIGKAQQLLRFTDLPITQIAHLVGFEDVTTFARNFRRQLGQCPRSFRRFHAGARNPGGVAED